MSSALATAPARPDPPPPAPPAAPTARRATPPWVRAAGAAALATAVFALLLTAFAWPAVRTAVRDLPVAVAGPAPALPQVEAALEAAVPGGFDVTRHADEAAARRAVLDREAYGAIVLGEEGPRVLVASAASPAAAQALRQVAAGLAAQAPGGGPGAVPAAGAPGDGPAGAPGGAGATPAAPVVEDLAPHPDGDPRGVAIGAAAFPLVLGGVATALLLGALVPGVGRQLVAVTAVALADGATTWLVLGAWLDALGGDPVTVVAAAALALGAPAAALLGLRALLGLPGFGLGALTLVLVGNPSSGAAAAPEMLPGRLGELGQLLPPGAAVTLLRSVSGSDGAGAAGPVAVLAAWLGLGAVLAGAAALRAAGGRGRRPSR